jgi:F0F1-type ATP synthase assembly protein I
MARTLLAVATAQALVPMVAFAIWRFPITSGVMEVTGVNVFFITLWVASALLFRQAAEPASAYRTEEQT